MDAAACYSDLTKQYDRYAGDARGWHYGLWEPDVRTHQQALLRSNERLLRGLDVGPSTRILDVGAGIGGFATWAARRFGCHVTGITVYRPPPAAAARGQAGASAGGRQRFEARLDRLPTGAGDRAGARRRGTRASGRAARRRRHHDEGGTHAAELLLPACASTHPEN